MKHPYHQLIRTYLIRQEELGIYFTRGHNQIFENGEPITQKRAREIKMLLKNQAVPELIQLVEETDVIDPDPEFGSKFYLDAFFERIPSRRSEVKRRQGLGNISRLTKELREFVRSYWVNGYPPMTNCATLADDFSNKIDCEITPRRVSNVLKMEGFLITLELRRWKEITNEFGSGGCPIRILSAGWSRLYGHPENAQDYFHATTVISCKYRTDCEETINKDWFFWALYHRDTMELISSSPRGFKKLSVAARIAEKELKQISDLRFVGLTSYYSNIVNDFSMSNEEAILKSMNNKSAIKSWARRKGDGIVFIQSKVKVKGLGLLLPK